MFIKECAEFLYDKYNDKISEIVIVMPGKRASLFFNLELSQLLQNSPVWQPKFVTLDQLFAQMSGMQQADKVKQLVDLYTIYSKYHNESFDKFYYWGEMLLSDFDEIDCYMIDAEELFSNSADLQEIEDRFDFLDAKEVEEIRRFWTNFRQTRSSTEKDYFMSIWKTLYPIYKEFREHLQSQGLAYRGMIYRNVAERLMNGELLPDTSQKYACIGFNALSSCEKILFKKLSEVCGADFLWDADNFYLQNSREEAGLFIRKNITLFGDSNKEASRDNYKKSKNIRIIDAPSDSLQCKYVWSFLTDCAKRAASKGEVIGRETAIVLTDESLLLPVLYSIADVVEQFNVTAGYELRYSTAYMLCQQLIALQQNKIEIGGKTEFYYKDVEALLAHPYIIASTGDKSAVDKVLSTNNSDKQVYYSSDAFTGKEFLSKLFIPIKGWKQLSDYLLSIIATQLQTEAFDDFNIYNRAENREFSYRLYESILSLSQLIEECGVEFSEAVYVAALRKHLTSQRISFEGEPLVGIQIMGILESRTLDFENVLLLNVNEDNFPSGGAVNSFIPSNLRLGYNLPTLQYREAMYSYYFYRLMQRAINIELAYVSSGDEMSNGEPSRYIRQIQYGSQHDISYLNLSIDLSSKESIAINAKKNEAVCVELDKYTTGARKMSPSALFCYIECPMKFYYNYIEGLRTGDDERETELGAVEIGNVVHQAIETIYKPLIGISNQSLKEILGKYDDAKIKAIVYNEAEKILSKTSNDFESAIENTLRFAVSYVRNVIRYDGARGDGFTVEGIERPIEATITVGDKQIYLKGSTDRVDRMGSGVVKLIDYKSGSPSAPSDIATLFRTGDTGLKKPVFQALLYAYMWQQKYGDAICPSLYYTRQMNKNGYSDHITVKGTGEIERYSEVAQEYEALLQERLGELLNSSIPFYKTDNSKVCEYCDYSQLCELL